VSPPVEPSSSHVTRLMGTLSATVWHLLVWISVS
jgi:hypothetical protein